jgi:hypothetical protein
MRRRVRRSARWGFEKGKSKGKGQKAKIKCVAAHELLAGCIFAFCPLPFAF